ncbi:MAG TPA: hypothetical protein ENK59_02060 [Thioploca sp.]|nr:hypothetical protein [Thioploca sp.]
MCRLLIILANLILVACSSSANQPIATQMRSDIKQINPNEVVIEDIRILVTELFPIEVNIVAVGNLPNSCTTINQITEEQKGDTLTLKITAKPRPICPNKIKQTFAEVIPLDVAGLTSGLYKVKVNNKINTFELGIDNIIR